MFSTDGNSNPDCCISGLCYFDNKIEDPARCEFIPWISVNWPSLVHPRIFYANVQQYHLDFDLLTLFFLFLTFCNMNVILSFFFFLVLVYHSSYWFSFVLPWPVYLSFFQFPSGNSIVVSVSQFELLDFFVPDLIFRFVAWTSFVISVKFDSEDFLTFLQKTIF